MSRMTNPADRGMALIVFSKQEPAAWENLDMLVLEAADGTSKELMVNVSNVGPCYPLARECRTELDAAVLLSQATDPDVHFFESPSRPIQEQMKSSMPRYYPLLDRRP